MTKTMNRLTDNDKNFGPFTLARWSKRFSIMFSSGDEEDGLIATNTLTLNGFGWVLRIRLPQIIQPLRIRHEAHWDAETVARLGRNYFYETHENEFGFSISDMGNGYDFLQIHFGPQTNDSSTTKDWCRHLPWKQWDCVRNSVYDPDGNLFATEQKGDFRAWWDAKEKCPASYFGFEDYDGDMIVATCRIEEMEWHRGEGWFKWLKWLFPRKIRRSLDLQFSAEVGPEKGSWKGGTTRHGIEMKRWETSFDAFVRYCGMEHDARSGRKYKIRFVGFCDPPTPRHKAPENAQNAQRTNPQ